jgi:hypothetical protein
VDPPGVLDQELRSQKTRFRTRPSPVVSSANITHYRRSRVAAAVINDDLTHHSTIQYLPYCSVGQILGPADAFSTRLLRGGEVTDD